MHSRDLWPDQRMRDVRVRAYTLDGVQVCWNGCQNSVAPGTLPGHIAVDTLLGITDWVKFACTADGELRWQPLGWQPAAIIHSNGIVAMMNEQLGAYGTTVTVLATAPSPLTSGPSRLLSSTPAPTTTAEADDEEVRTPPTPPMRD